MTAPAPPPPERPLSARVAGAAMNLAGRRVAITLMSGLSTAFVARFLGPESYGALAAAIATWTLLLAAADFGFTLALSRELAVEPDRQGAILRAGYQVQTALAAVLTAVAVAIALAAGLGTDLGACQAVLAPSILFAGLAGARVIFNVRYDLRRIVLIELLVTAVQVTLMVVAAVLAVEPVLVAATISAGYVVTALLIARQAGRVVDPGRPTGADRRALIHHALPLGVMGFMSKVYLTVDLVILAWLASGPQLGDYAAATKLLTLLATVPGLIIASALPAFATEFARDGGLEAITTRVWHWLFVSAVPIFVGAAVFAPLIVTVAVGSAFDGAADLLRILAIAGLIGVVSNFLGTILVALRVVRPLLWQNLAALILNVGGNIVLVPIHGVMASAWLTVGTEALVCTGSLIVLSRTVRFRPWLAISVRPLLAIVPATVLAVVLSRWTYVAVPVAAAAFVAAIVVARGWPHELRLAALRGS